MTAESEKWPDGEAIAAFQRHILDWYAAFGRKLPWRGDPDPYHILVSEVMLQQTGVARVLDRYPEFLQRFPTIESLAAASRADVISAWQGLGYNRRALNLKRAAEMIVRDHGGRVPREVAQLETLPGIGPYTARAVASFAFQVQVPVVDTNVRRVLSNWVGRDLTLGETWDLARRILPQGKASDWNGALMDYGALVQRATPRRTERASQPFVTTNRFWRGRIVDALRANPQSTMAQLVDALPYPNRDEERIRHLVSALHDEGMVTYDPDGDTVALPT